jgi:hypothetical protein
MTDQESNIMLATTDSSSLEAYIARLVIVPSIIAVQNSLLIVSVD